MKKITPATFIILLAALIFIGSFIFGESNLGARNIFQKKTEISKAKAETYQIVQAADREPKIIQAVIDPQDVHVSDKQTLTLIVQDDAEIASVIAKIETDKDTVTLPLVLMGEVAAKEILPPKYAVGEDDKLFAVNSAPGKQISPGFTAMVSAATESPKLKYQGSWVVRDTHDIKYHTTFEVKDFKGRTNSIVLAWSDLCQIPPTGAWSLSWNGNCTQGANSVDGVEAGQVNINSGTLTISSGATFVWNPGRSIVLTGGTIAIGSGASLKKTEMWAADADGDHYWSSATYFYAQTNAPSASWVRRSTIISDIVDCDDSNASLNVLNNLYYDADGDGIGYYMYAVCLSGPTGNYTNNGGDCDDSNRYIWWHTYDSGGACVGNSTQQYLYGSDGAYHYCNYFFTSACGGIPSTNNYWACPAGPVTGC